MKDILDICVEEIALEGLDGISMKTLWERLAMREPSIGLDVNDEHVRGYLWRGIREYKGLYCYHVRVPWKNPVVRKAFEPLEMTNGMYLIDEKARELEDHPVRLVHDGPIRGSCSTYYQRDDVTKSIRNVDLDEVERRYGGDFVMVGSQNDRERAVFGSIYQNTIKTEISDPEYMLLERVGRARRAGAIPMLHRPDSDEKITGVRTDKKTQFYHRKRMIKYGYLCSKPFVYHTGQPRGHTNTVKSTCIMFLTRFDRHVCNRMSEQLHKMADILQQTKFGTEVYSTIRETMNVSVKLFKQMLNYHRYFQVEFQPVSMFYTASSEEDKDRVDLCKDGRVRTVRCVTLVKHPRDYDEETEEEEEPVEEATPLLSTTCYNRSVAHEAYARLVNAGPEGLSISQFQQVFGVDNKSARSIVRSLCRSGYVFYYIVDKHKQRLMKIVARCYEESCDMKRWTDLERGGLEKLIKSDETMKEDETDQGPKSKRSRRSIKPEKKNTVVSLSFGNDDSTGEDETKPRTSMSDSFPSPFAMSTYVAEQRTATPKPGCSPKAEVLMELTEEDRVVNQITRHTDVKNIFNTERNERLVSAKYLSRARHILEAVKAQQVVEHVYILRKEIAEAEKTDGHAGIIDPKVMQRIINSLQSSGQIRSVKSFVKVGSKEKKIHILCDPSVDPTTDSRVQAVFDKAKLELTKRAVEKTGSAIEGSISASEPVLKRQVNRDYDKKMARRYGALPKMKQIESLHKYLYYCMYGYEGMDIDQSFSFEQGPIDQCRVYKDEYTIKRFIPPIPKRHGFELDGWFLLGDIIWAMPLVTFCQLVNICYDVPVLIDLLADPVKKYVPLYRQDGSLTQVLMAKRTFMFRILHLLTRMCHMGLLSFGPAIMKEKDQVPCFLHRNATLFDTTKSKAGYCRITEGLDYPKTLYTFNSYTDVEDYWNDLQFICVNTQLGALRKDTDQPEKFDYKQLLNDRAHALQPFSNPKKVDEISDTGELPGDGRGAAGLDTSFFGHRKSNWTHGSLNPFSMKDHYKDPEQEKLMKQPIAKYMKRKDRKDVSKPIPMKSPKKTKKKTKVKVKSRPSSTEPEPQPSTSKAGMHEEHELNEPSPPNDPVPVPSKSGKSTRPSTSFNLSTRTRPPRRILAKKTPPKQVKESSEPKPKRAKLKPRPYVPKKKSKEPAYKQIQHEKDIDAKKRMRTMRVRWSTGEDNMLLWFKIGHLFLGYHEVIMSWPDLRDILNKHFPNVSMDKTSRACARRLLFMCRNPNTTRTINLLANQALHNEELVKKYSDCRVKNKDIIKADKFDQLVIDLRTMLRSAPTDTKLPDSLEELYEQYNLTSCDGFSFKPDCTVHKDIVTVQDVCESTLHSLIHSTVWLGEGRETRSVDLFKVYKQYPDELLTLVCRRMVNDRMITKLKVLKSNMTPCSLTSMKSYQLSQRYQYILNNITHHPNTMFDNAAGPYTTLSSGFNTGNRTEVDCTDKDDVGMTINMVTYTALRKLIYTVNIPEHLIVVELENHSNQVPDTVPPAQTQSDNEDDELITELSGKQSDSWNSSKSTLKTRMKDMKLSHASRFLLSMARHHHFRSLQVSNDKKQRLSSHDILAVKPCELKVRFKKNVRQPPSHVPKVLMDAILQRMESVQPEHVDYNNFLEQCKGSFHFQECVEIDNLHKSIAAYRHVGMTRHELVNLCPDLHVLERRLSILLTGRVVLKVGVTVDRYVSYIFIRAWLVHAYRTLPSRDHALAPVNVAEDSVQLDPVPESSVQIINTEPSGDGRVMDTSEPTPSTSQSVTTRPKRAKKQTRSTERVRLVCRPWRYPEGPINKPALKRFLEAMMLAVLSNPGISEKALEARFDPILQPVQIRDLLDVLAQVGCVRVHCFEGQTACTLFSSRQPTSLAAFDDGQSAKVYIPTVDAILRMSQVVKHIENYNT